MNVPSTTRPRPSSESSVSDGDYTESLPVEFELDAEQGDKEIDIIKREPLHPHRNARELVRLVQCQICSKLLQQPVALPCGETLCKSCIPETFLRENISYPAVPDRLQGFVCPFRLCERREHSLADCGVDVTLTRILESLDAKMRSPESGPTTGMLLEEILPADVGLLDGVQSRSQVLSGGRLAATYQMASAGLLRYDAEVHYTPMTTESGDHEELDIALLGDCLNSIRPEMECQVCYNLLLDPITTGCGHTFCRTCLERVLDHSTLCPLCRRNLPPISTLSFQPANIRMEHIIGDLCPDLVEIRLAAENILNEGTSEMQVPIFVCALSFPTMPMFLHIFEPRYRLMVRRALESPSRSFGIVDHNRSGRLQGVDGDFDAPFMQYGTLLHITGFQMMPDGRSLIESVGTTRFKVNSWEEQDGYTIGHIDRVDDIPMADEEAMEAMERVFHTFPQGSIPEWARLPTLDLLQIGIDFVATMRRSSAGWFHDRILRTYGNPPADPATFPYWLATLLPVDDEEKYQLLMASSVRERLKIVVGWIKAIEQRHWFSNAMLANSCIIS